MEFSVSEWLNLITRWVHVFAGIMWVGQTYYFTWLDAQMSKEERADAKDSALPQVWMVHSGGFYAVEKQKALGVAPEKVHWFRWEAAVTWLSGMVLLVLIYYMGGALLDESVADISLALGIIIGVSVITLGWELYHYLVRESLFRSDLAFSIVSLALVAGTSYGLTRVFSGRAAYIHLGGLFGTIMAFNVWFCILPAQRKLIAAAAQGQPFDAALSAQAKLRSKHNTFLAVPVVFIMLSSHFPTATYGNSYNWEILSLLVLAGWVAAMFIRRA